MGKYDKLSRKELIARLEEAEQNESAQLRDRLDGEQRLAKALILMLQNYNGNNEEDIMRIVLERYQADRAFIFRFNWENGTNSNIYEVNAPGISSEINNLQYLPNEALKDYLKQFRQGEPLIVNDVDQMQNSSYLGPNHIKEVFQKLKLRSAILFPMHIFGELWGYVGMELVRNYRKWSKDDIEWLGAFTNVLCIGISQRFIRLRAERNERKFSELFNNMPVGYVHHRLIYDGNNNPVDYKFLDANPAFEKLTGIPKEKCIGKTARQINHQLDPELLKSYAEVAATGKQIQLDYSTPLLNKWFYSVLYSPTKDEFISLFYDITERIRATKLIKQNEKKLSTIFDNLPVGIVAFDAKENFVSANNKAFEIFGTITQKKLTLSPEAQKLLNEKQLLDFDFIYDPVQQQALSEKINLPETALFISCKILKYIDDTGKYPGYLIIAVDNTKIYRTNRKLAYKEEKLIEAIQKAEESDKLKSAFLANVSHEIRTPLNAIIGFSELIVNTQEEEEKKYYFDIVKTNNDLLLNLINDILDLSKIESGRIDLKETAVNVTEVCQELCHMYQLKAPAEVKIIFANSPDPYMIKTDRNRLIQLYSNLLNNAVKNTSKGSIIVGYESKNNQLECFVRDTGKGIPQEKQTAIFNRFEKLDSNIQGFGLGLSICKTILEKMGGSITLTSEEGKGSEFRFTLPLSKEI